MAVASSALRASGNAAVAAPQARYRKLAPGPGMPPAAVAANQIARLQGATIDIVARDGYDGAKVRDIARVAGVSTRAFYEHFDSKLDCVAQTYELVMRRASRRIIASQMGEPDWRKRARLMLNAFVEELQAGPNTARFALVELPGAGPGLAELIRRTEHNFESLLAECLARPPQGIVIPPLVVEGIVAGATRVVSDWLVGGMRGEVPGTSSALMEWALCYADERSVALEELDRRSMAGSSRSESTKLSSAESGCVPSSAEGDRGLILAAVAKLTVIEGYAALTVPKIRRTAGVSRRAFDSSFRDVDDCFTAALDQRGKDLLARCALAQVSSRTWSGGVYRAIVTLCDQVAADLFLVKVCFNDASELGSSGGQSRQRLIRAISEQLADGVPVKHRSTKLAVEATGGSFWAVFKNHAVDWAQRSQIGATLAYMVLAPAIGCSGAIAAIAQEQKG